jgi:hypothetical protein
MPVSFTQNSVRQKIAYIAQLYGETALKRGKEKGALDIAR